MRLRPKLNKKTGTLVNMLRAFMLLCTVAVLASFTHQRTKEKGSITVVIDAGHGGHDSGCLGSHAKEKDVTLAVALKLGNFITDNFKDVKVIYTRKTDVFIGLDERASVANTNKADLFISIHCNSGAKAAYGVETYVMGLHRTEENLAVSKRENSVVLLEKDYKTKYEGFDPNSPEGNIIFTLYQNAFLEQSLKISTLVQLETSDFAGRHNRGVKQAGFLVLYKTSMPSILIETGFLTNPAEERYLLSKEGQEKLAYSLFNAFSKYKNSMGTNAPVEVEAKKEPDKDSSDRKTGKPSPESVPADISPAEAKTSEAKPVVKTEDTTEDSKKYVVKPVVEKPPAADAKAKQPENTMEVHKPATASDELYFTVQIATSGKLLGESHPAFKGEKNIFSENVNGLYKYMTGKYAGLNEALRRQNQLRGEGFTDAFVVAYRKGVRITLKEARMLLEKN